MIRYAMKVWKPNGSTTYRGLTGIVVRPQPGQTIESGRVLVAWSDGHLRAEPRAQLQEMQLVHVLKPSE